MARGHRQDVQFTIDAATFGIRNFVFLPTANPLDMTNGAVTPVFASKTAR